MKSSIFTVLVVIFVVLKLVDVIAWSWWWVFAPWWVPWSFWMAIIIGGSLISGVANLRSRKTRMKDVIDS